ncbi:hypothetical protein CH063_14756 [Colletotrichum higginsianum]|uniref:Uncharacterized protein n=1 Tax=Colletotrichum higginsianum (strain IMI 349063) TaxID=759273 RepID=H1VZY3_COLHI|nr:hypothetical protein CH63R_13151 [Colletotrichum higginsianum IMI 349063]OBR04024.1 hypothetical protein CH63R_13151 [Colletotrichum higginsianum IMI 349063]CCF45795.1 hypothetical protein CH063_14756 [Colletotrichum higginsianum]
MQAARRLGKRLPLLPPTRHAPSIRKITSLQREPAPPSARAQDHDRRDRYPPADALRQGSRVETSDGDVLLRRIGKCLSFGCTPPQTADAAALVRDIADNWLAIQMTLAARSPQARDLVYTGALWKDSADRILDPSTPRPWKGIGRHAQLVRVGQEAAVRFLDYSLATAPPRYQKMWEKLRDEGERNHGHEVPPHLELADVWLAHVDNRVLQTQNVSALARLDSHKRFLDNGEFTLTVSIWSHRYIAKLADATVLVTYNTNTAHRNETFLNKELRRMADLGLDPPKAYHQAMQKGEAVLCAVEKLEKDTWDSADAVEDFGSASTA